MKLKVEDILKPGAVMVTEKIDFDDPKNAETVKQFQQTRESQDRMKQLKREPFKNYVINI